MSFDKILEDEIKNNYADMAGNKCKMIDKELKEKATLYVLECEQIFKAYNHGCMFREYLGVEKDIKIYIDRLKIHCHRVISEGYSNEKKEKREYRSYVSGNIGTVATVIALPVAILAIGPLIYSLFYRIVAEVTQL